jgi:hypothetical protein
MMALLLACAPDLSGTVVAEFEITVGTATGRAWVYDAPLAERVIWAHDPDVPWSQELAWDHQVEPPRSRSLEGPELPAVLPTDQLLTTWWVQAHDPDAHHWAPVAPGIYEVGNTQLAVDDQGLLAVQTAQGSVVRTGGTAPDVPLSGVRRAPIHGNAPGSLHQTRTADPDQPALLVPGETPSLLADHLARTGVTVLRGSTPAALSLLPGQPRCVLESETVPLPQDIDPRCPDP